MYKCRACNGEELEKIIDFGQQPLAGGFLIEEQIQDEKKYPLSIYICPFCGLIQIMDVIPPNTLNTAIT